MGHGWPRERVDDVVHLGQLLLHDLRLLLPTRRVVVSVPSVARTQHVRNHVGPVLEGRLVALEFVGIELRLVLLSDHGVLLQLDGAPGLAAWTLQARVNWLPLFDVGQQLRRVLVQVVHVRHHSVAVQVLSVLQVLGHFVYLSSVQERLAIIVLLPSW